MSHRDGPRWVRASDLAQLAVCERLVLYEQRFGKRRTPGQARAAQRGEWAHENILRADVVVDPAVKTDIDGKPGALSPRSRLRPTPPKPASCVGCATDA